MAKRRLICGAALLLLSGCGYNQIRLDRAGVVSEAGTHAVDTTRSFIRQVRQARDDANIALVASDESCAWGESIILYGSGRAQPKPPARAPFCLPRGQALDENLGDVEIKLAPVSTSAIRPSIEAIDAIAAYIEAVNEILERDEPDVSGRLSDAYEKALTAQANIAAITGDDLKIIPQLKEEQLSAITGLIDLIVELQTEERKVSELRALVRDQNEKLGVVIGQLQGAVTVWGNSSLTGDLQLSNAAYVALGRQLAADPPVYRGFDARRAILIRIVESRRHAEAGKNLSAAVNLTLGELAKAQNGLVDAFSKSPRWTEAERKKAAKINRERALGALRTLASFVTAF
jgi:hypothetical protein